MPKAPRDKTQGEIVTLRLDPATRDLVDALAERYGLTRSATLRQAIHRWALDDEYAPLKRAG